jgi:hypothetical protein
MADLPIELGEPEGAELEENLQGESARRVFLCHYATWEDEVPQIGEPFPGRDKLHCAARNAAFSGPADGEGNPYSYAQITCTYATFEYLEGDLIWSFQGGTECLETGVGKWWKYAKTPCDQIINVSYTLIHCRATRLMASDPVPLALQQINKINGKIWQPTPASPRFSAGTLLFQGPEVEQYKDYNRSRSLGRSVWFYRTTWCFLFRPYGHNWAWRLARQMVDQYGVPVTTGLDQAPVFVPGLPGESGWDWPEPRNYEYGDFGPMMGLAGSGLPKGDPDNPPIWAL